MKISFLPKKSGAWKNLGQDLYQQTYGKIALLQKNGKIRPTLIFREKIFQTQNAGTARGRPDIHATGFYAFLVSENQQFSRRRRSIHFYRVEIIAGFQVVSIERNLVCASRVIPLDDGL